MTIYKLVNLKWSKKESMRSKAPLTRVFSTKLTNRSMNKSMQSSVKTALMTLRQKILLEVTVDLLNRTLKSRK